MSVLFAEPCAPWPADMWCEKCRALVAVVFKGARELTCKFCEAVLGEWLQRAGLVYPPRPRGTKSCRNTGRP